MGAAAHPDRRPGAVPTELLDVAHEVAVDVVRHVEHQTDEAGVAPGPDVGETPGRAGVALLGQGPPPDPALRGLSMRRRHHEDARSGEGDGSQGSREALQRGVRRGGWTRTRE